MPLQAERTSERRTYGVIHSPSGNNKVWKKTIINSFEEKEKHVD